MKPSDVKTGESEFLETIFVAVPKSVPEAVLLSLICVAAPDLFFCFQQHRQGLALEVRAARTDGCPSVVRVRNLIFSYTLSSREC